MVLLPNWVDVLILTIIWKACYGGFGRGLVLELANVVIAVCVTEATVTYWSIAANALGVPEWFPAYVKNAGVFWGIFLSVWLIGYVAKKRLAGFIKEKRWYWITHGGGLFLGGVRGLWWSGFLLLVLSSSGFSSLRDAVEQRSVLGPRLLKSWRTGFLSITNRFPAAAPRHAAMSVPPLRRLEKSQ